MFGSSTTADGRSGGLHRFDLRVGFRLFRVQGLGMSSRDCALKDLEL